MQLTTEHLIRMQVPEVHWKATFSKIPDGCRHKARIREYLDNLVENVRKPKGLLLFGDLSAGKSGIASILLKAAASSGILGYWVVARNLPDLAINHVVFDREMTCIERASTVLLLVIDELIIRKDVRFTEQILEGLVRHRVDHRLCTVITTNHTPDQVRANYPELAAALLEAVVPLRVTGVNFREQIAKGLADG